MENTDEITDSNFPPYMAKPKLKKILLGTLLTLLLLALIGWLSKDSIKQWAGGKYFSNLETEFLKEDFRGIETSEGKVKGLFPIRATGVSTLPIKEAAVQFLTSLDADQKEQVSFAIEDEEWRRWCNVDNGIYDRQGISLKEMDAAQKAAAFGLMQASLSAKGLQLSKDIMKTDQTLRELNAGASAYDEELYFFTVMGHALRNSALGLATGWASPRDQLFCPGGPGGHVACLLGR